MASKVFISYDFDNNSCRGNISKWLKEDGIEAVIIEEKGLVKPESKQQVQSKLDLRISECNGMIVLVGDNVHDRTWVNFEVNIAIRKGIPIRWSRMPKTNGGLPPRVNEYPEVTYNDKAITAAARSM